MILKTAISISFFLATLHLPAQNPVITAVQTTADPSIDGKLDDEAWKTAEVYSAFRMVEPTPGSDPTERTELRVVYTKTAIIFGIRCYDSEPKKILNLVHDQI